MFSFHHIDVAGSRISTSVLSQHPFAEEREASGWVETLRCLAPAEA